MPIGVCSRSSFGICVSVWKVLAIVVSVGP
jgi:hypothetical protein